MSAAAAPVAEVRRPARRRARRLGPPQRLDLSLLGLLVVLLVFTKFIQPRYGVPGIQGLGTSRSCRSPSPPSRRPSSSCRAGSTCRSDR